MKARKFEEADLKQKLKGFLQWSATNLFMCSNCSLKFTQQIVRVSKVTIGTTLGCLITQLLHHAQVCSSTKNNKESLSHVLPHFSGNESSETETIASFIFLVVNVEKCYTNAYYIGETSASYHRVQGIMSKCYFQGQG